MTTGTAVNAAALFAVVDGVFNASCVATPYTPTTPSTVPGEYVPESAYVALLVVDVIAKVVESFDAFVKVTSPAVTAKFATPSDAV